MQTLVLKKSHEDKFLEQGYLFVLQFAEGHVVARVVGRTWSNLKTWSLGACAAKSNIAAYDEVQDTLNRHFLEPQNSDIIYHSFWGITPAPARIFVQYPARTNVGSMLQIDRLVAPAGGFLADVGYIDGRQSPFNGPFSHDTEIFTVKEQYPAFQAYNPLNDNMSNVMLTFQQMQYTYQIIKDAAIVKAALLGTQRATKYTMGPVYKTMAIPDWLSKKVTPQMLDYSNRVMQGVA
jgi:hypothetical protein